MGLTDYDLIELALTTRFTHDANGRIRFENEPGGVRAPRFVFARTVVGNAWRLRDDLNAELVQQLDALATAEPVHLDIRCAPVQLAAFQRVLASHTIGDHVAVSGGPHYRFPEPRSLSVETISIEYDTRALMSHFVSDFDTFSREFMGRQPRRAMVVDGAAVAVCWSARLGDQAAEAGVETLEAFRGHGYAGVVVTAWAQDVRASGRIPLYGTSWDNVASQAVARKLGLVAYASMWDVG